MKNICLILASLVLILSSEPALNQDLASDSVAVVSILAANNLGNLGIRNVAQIDTSIKRIIDLDFSYSWGSGTIGTVHVNGPINKLPNEIGVLSELRTLILGDTYLDSIPAAIGNLRNLREIYIGSFHGSSLPDSFGNLVNLKKLGLNMNGFQTFPMVVFNIAGLDTLYLQGVNVDSIPSGIGKLRSLKSLTFFNANLVAIPQEIGTLDSLRTLSITNGTCSVLPVEIGSLSNLSKLEIAHTPLIYLPNAIENLIKLDTLVLSYTQLASLPGGIRKLNSLHYLYVGDNKLCNMPDSIANWIDSYIVAWETDWRLHQWCTDVVGKSYPLFRNGPEGIGICCVGRTISVSYHVEKTGKVSVDLYDICGRKVKNLFDHAQTKGIYKLSFNVGHFPQSICLIRIGIGNSQLTKKVLLKLMSKNRP